MSASPSSLHVLVCSGNLGNAEPDEASIDAWLPLDGSYHNVVPTHVEDPKYPLAPHLISSQGEVLLDSSSSSSSSSKNKSKEDSIDNIIDSQKTMSSELFDLVVIGMQEATFTSRSSRGGAGSSRLNSNNTPGSGGGNTPKSAALANSSDKSYRETAAAAVVSPILKVKDTLGGGLEMGLATFTQVAGSKDHTRAAPAINLGENRGEIKLTLNPSEVVGGTSKLTSLITERLGRDAYSILVQYQRGEMRLMILVHRNLMKHFKVLNVKAENTGIGHVLANKGGILGELLHKPTKTRLSFISAHLEAHEGSSHYKARCSDLMEIFAGTKTTRYHDVAISSHYTFLCGDLNFRINNPKSINATTKKSSPCIPEGDEDEDEQEEKEEQNEYDNNNDQEVLLNQSNNNSSSFGLETGTSVTELVEEHNYQALNEVDELNNGLKQKDCLVGFQTLPCFFPPTFKVEREEGFNYKVKRTPSYTDRILWRSAKGFENGIRPVVYEPISQFCTSDHKPIRGAFLVDLKADEHSLAADATAADDEKERGETMPKRGSSNRRRFSIRGPGGGGGGRQRPQRSLSCAKRLHVSFCDMRCSNLVCPPGVSRLTGGVKGGGIVSALHGKGEKSKNSSSNDTNSSRSNKKKNLPDPFLIFVTAPKGLIRQEKNKWAKFVSSLGQERSGAEYHSSGWPRTSKKSKTSCPNWGYEEIHLVVKNSDDDKAMTTAPLDLSGAMLYVTVMHQWKPRDNITIGSSYDGVIGTAQVNLHQLSLQASQQHRLNVGGGSGGSGNDNNNSGSNHIAGLRDDAAMVEVNEPLIRDGKETGRLRCTVFAWWLREMDRRMALHKKKSSMRQLMPRKKCCGLF